MPSLREVGVQPSRGAVRWTLPVQRSAEDAGEVLSPAMAHRAAAEGISEPGGALPHLSQIQRAFGRHDVSGIRAHTGPRAARASRAISARAFTTGEHIAFSGSPDLHTVAHEAAHVVQQRRGVNLASGIGQTGDRYEQHADRVAERVRSGQGAEDLLDKVPGSESMEGRAENHGGSRAVQGLFLQRLPAGGCARNTGSPAVAGGAAHTQIQNFVDGTYERELGIPRATKNNITDAGCQPAGTPLGFADLWQNKGRTVELAEIKSINSANTGKARNEVEHYIRRVEQSRQRHDATSTQEPCSNHASGPDDQRFFNDDLGSGPRGKKARTLNRVFSGDTTIGPFDHDPTLTLRAQQFGPGQVAYWCVLPDEQGDATSNSKSDETGGAATAEQDATESAEQKQDTGGGLALVSRASPALSIPFTPPDGKTVSLTSPLIDRPGVQISKAEFNLKTDKLPAVAGKRQKAFKLKSGSVEMGIDMAGLVTSDDTKSLDIEQDEAMELSPSAVYARFEDSDSADKFDDGLHSRLDSIFRDRITTEASVTDNGVQAALQVSEGELGSSGLLLEASELAATMGSEGVGLSGHIGLSDKDKNITGGLDVGWDGSALTIQGSATVSNLIEGLQPFTATITYDRSKSGEDGLELSVDEVAFARNLGTIPVTGTARQLRYDFKSGEFSGQASLSAELGALGTVGASAQIAKNEIQRATFSYKKSPVQFPTQQPMFTGDLTSQITYDDGEISGSVKGKASLQLPALSRLGQGDRPIAMKAQGELSSDGTMSADLRLLTPVQIGPYFTVSELGAQMGTDRQFDISGAMELDSNIFHPARLAIAYRDGQFSGSGTVGIGAGKIIGVESASLDVTLADDKLAGKGTLNPTIRQIQRGTVTASYSPTEGFSFGGSLTLGDIPYVKGGAVDLLVAKRPDAESYDVTASGGLTVALPGFTASADADYSNGAFTIEGKARYKRGLAQGTVTIGVTNRQVDEKGDILDQIGDRFTPYGSGAVSVKLTPWLQGTARIRLLPNGELEIGGGLSASKPITFFKKKGFNKKLFSVGIDIPILGFTVPVIRQRVGIFATVGGSASLDAGVGPGRLTQANLDISYNPDHPEKTRLTGGAQIRIPASAGITLSVHGALGAGIPIVSATLGLEAKGRLGIGGALEAGVDMAWNPTDGLSFDALGAISAQPQLRFDLSGFADVSADVYVTTYELYHKEWKLASFKYGPDMRLGMKFPVHYDSKQGLSMPWDKVEFETPEIDTMKLLEGLIGKVK